jgi:tRNA1Val (adenine37-N6)-methyltransferase
MSQNRLTTDTFFNGRVKVFQSTHGYRFSIDAVLLAAMVYPKPGEVVMDMGTGCGVVPIVLAFRYPRVQFVGIELQDELAKIAMRNVAANGMQDQIEILNQDVRSLKNEIIGGPVDWIVTNPPYRRAHSGKINPDSERAVARHEIHLSLHELMEVCRRFLRTGGRFAIVYPAERLTDLFYEMRSAGIEPKWMQSVHSHQGDEAKLALVRGMMRGKPGLKVAPPLIIYASDGAYSKAVEEMMEP